MPTVTNGGVKIRYDVIGEGRPLVLLRGWAGDRSWWTEPGYVDELRSDHRLLIVDIRGHGASDKPHEAAAYSSDALIGDVLAIADAEGLGRFAIWGLSYGGGIAWVTAANIPERVPAIVVSGAWDPRPDPEYSIETTSGPMPSDTAAPGRWSTGSRSSSTASFHPGRRRSPYEPTQRRYSPPAPCDGPAGSRTKTSGRSRSLRCSSPAG